MITQDDVVTLIDELLAEQRRLTAVDRFSRQQAEGSAPLLESHYRSLIPLTAPRPGEQYAFEVDLDSCSSCKACVSACHALNGLDDDETWRSVGFLRGHVAETAPAKVIPLTQVVTTACHHCVEPACLLGCPVLAYDKDPATGIVRHLDDQCIGCSYCILKCPYDVPKYSAKRGIVRKCDLCHGRLAEGEAPACVQACPSAAISVTLVLVAAVRTLHRESKENSFLPASPDPAYTLPTTRYRTRQSATDLHAADEDQLRPAPPHWPLVGMLVLTQLGIGMLLGVAGRWWSGVPADTVRPEAVAGFLLFAAGLAASVFHLGRPAKAWRVWMGWRTSWLSREAIALNGFAGVAAVFVASLWLPEPRILMPALLGIAVALLGAVGVFAQSMVYVDTRRSFWAWRETGPRFLGVVLLGTLQGAGARPGWLIAVALVSLVLECRVLTHVHEEAWTALRRTAALLRGPLREGWTLRVVLGLLLVAGAGAGLSAVPLAVLLTASVASERWLFFRAVSPDRMPGQPV